VEPFHRALNSGPFFACNAFWIRISSGVSGLHGFAAFVAVLPGALHLLGKISSKAG